MCRDHDPDNQRPANAAACSFTVRQLNSVTTLVRENDRFGEYPHIYVRLITVANPQGESKRVLLVNDTGVGTTSPNASSKPKERNMRTVIDEHCNPAGDIPYLIVLSHCHYDHILGLTSLNPPEPSNADTVFETEEPATPPVTILSSSRARDFATPYARLMENSLCNSTHLTAPHYSTSIWAGDQEAITYTHPSGDDIRLPIITLHTPGHTPDSLSWYDTEERVLYIGDSFYEKESVDTQEAPWGPEGPAPILFPNEGNLLDWWRSIEKLIHFVKERNAEDAKRVVLAAGHVSVMIDAEINLHAVKEFVEKVLQDKADFEERPMKRGQRFGYWSYNRDSSSGLSRFCLGAPLFLIERGRKEILEL